VVTNLLLLINVIVFGYQLGLPQEQFNQFFMTWGFVPLELTRGDVVEVVPKIFTSMFLHGGFMHVIGNMLFLWVFGDNVEDELGHLQFLIFYFVAGTMAVLGQYWFAPFAEIPMVGASGAISGILGAYLLLFPSTPVLTIVVIIIFVRMFYLPAWFFLGYWFLIQFLSGTMSVGAQSMGGVAWFAHIGGFIAGFVWVVLYWIGGVGRR